MKIIERIKQARHLLRETTDEFGLRFNKTGSMVGYWENGKSQAPYEVIEFSETIIENLQFCPACNGTGVFNKSQRAYVIALGKEGLSQALPQYNGEKDILFRLIAGTPEIYSPSKGEE